MEHLISMYIDDELSIDEKILFVEQVYARRTFKDDAVSLLEQEKLLSAALRYPAPEIALPDQTPPRARTARFRFLGLAVAACLLLLLSFMAGRNFMPQDLAGTDQAVASHRFVIYQQGTSQVEITGSFTNWQRVPLSPSGTSGYWEVTLDVPAGEHRYTFIVDGSKQLPDPTVATGESDDFGAVNSILKIEV